MRQCPGRSLFSSFSHRFCRENRWSDLVTFWSALVTSWSDLVRLGPILVRGSGSGRLAVSFFHTAEPRTVII
jgi:hypothetical protein